MNYKTILLCLLLSINTAHACINGSEEIEPIVKRSEQAELASSLQYLTQKYDKSPSPRLANDIAVLHILTGAYPQAIELLNKTEAQYPGMSITAANLGTALELSGDNKLALHWIKQGVIRDANEHQGSEWLHVKILEAKIALSQNPNWLKNNTILGIDFGKKTDPAPPNKLVQDFQGKQHDLQHVAQALDYQLGERIKFVPPPDPIVADLYAARGDIATLQADLSLAKISYKTALHYRSAQKDLLEQRIDKLPPSQGENQDQLLLWSGIAGVVLFLTFVVCWSRRKVSV